MTRPVRRSGLTLIELLVVLSIIAMLAGLLLPAVQAARETARRVTCQNNLRQLGLALQQHHAVERRFPPGVSSGAKLPYLSRLGWCPRLLPYLEQGDLWNTVLRDYERWPNPFTYHTGVALPLPVVSCPSDGRAERPHIARGQILVALTNYLGVSGTDFQSEDGLLYLDSRISLAMVSDGTSNTIVLGERPATPDYFFGWWYAGMGVNGSGAADLVLGARELNIGYDRFTTCPLGRSSFQRGDLADFCSGLHFWSTHPGGACFAWADGSVRFLTYEVAPLLAQLATRAGGE